LSTHTVDRSGLVLLGGIANNGDSSSFRLDAILPVPLDGAPRFRVGIVLMFAHASASLPSEGIAVDTYGLSAGANVHYDWRLPVATSLGDLVVSVEGGPFVGNGWAKVDEPFMPGTYDRFTVLALRGATALQLRMHGGFVASLQPIGLVIPLTHPSSSGSMLTVTTKATWEGALLCGYQFD